MTESTTPRRINLALQGGGPHGALTWGVLDALLEDDSIALDSISGTSAGAMNAVAVAYGFAKAAQQYNDPQDIRHAGAQLARATLTRLWEGTGTLGNMAWSAPLSQAFPGLAMMTPWFAPAQANPLDINPLRQLLEREIDFRLLANSSCAPHVFVCATNVRTGQGEIFSGSRLTADAVMASACLPLVFKAVEIDGQAYWDGCYSSNPPLYPLIYSAQSSDILLVQINPVEHLRVPATVPEITDRVNEVTFNACLLAELRSIEFARRLHDEGKIDTRHFREVYMHRIDGGAVLAEFGMASKTRADLGFMRHLFTLGRTIAQQWLQKHHNDIGVRSSFQLEQ